MAFKLEFQALPASPDSLRFALVPWDSELYGFPMYELRCGDTPAEVVAECLLPWLAGLPTGEPCLVYTKIPTPAVALGCALTQRGFYPVETLLDLGLPLARLRPITEQHSEHCFLRLAKEAELPALVAIARAAFRADRLHLDPHLPSSKADERFARWIERGIRDGEPVFVFEDRRSGRIAGFVHLREVGPRTIDLSLGAVDATYQHPGIGVLMFQEVLARCRADGYLVATTWTPVNNPNMVNLLVRLGFSFRSPVATFHWFQATGGNGNGKHN